MRTQDAVSEPDARAQLRQLIMGFRATQLVHVAARLCLADHLRDPLSVEILARRVGIDERIAFRLLRALGTLDLFAQTDDGRFFVKPLGRLLLKDSKGSLRDLALLYGADWLWATYGALHYSVKSGRPAFDRVHGQNYYSYLSENPVAAEQFNAAMTGFSGLEVAAILEAYNFSDMAVVVDIGGGQGRLLGELLEAHPRVRGVILDLEPAITVAQHGFARAGLAARVDCVVGNFFDEVPPGGDAYILKSVIHNWNDTDALMILKNCSRAMSPGSRLLIVERLVPAGNAPSESKLFDINMMVVVGGQERNLEEYGTLLKKADLELNRVIETNTHLTIIEAAPSEESRCSARGLA